MANGSTPNYSYILPEVGADNGAWGTHNSANWSDIDTDLKVVSDAVDATVIVANAALPKAGGTTTGAVDMLAVRRKVQQLGTISGSVTVNLALGHDIRCELSGPTTFAFSNVPSGSTYRTQIRMHIYNPSGSYAITWPGAIAWEVTRLAPTGTTGFVTPNFNSLVEVYTDSAGSDYFGYWRAF